MKTRKKLLISIFAIIAVIIIVAFTVTPLTEDVDSNSSDYTISKTWKMPKELEEISGIAFLNDNEVACIQDEDGIIFIYNLEIEKITNKIEFGDSGDYEGIAVNGEDAYVMRSDGVVFEITDFLGENKKVTSFATDFSSKNNMESLLFNTEDNSLLTAPKDKDLNNDDFKGIYEIPLNSKKMKVDPLLKINMKAAEFKDFHEKKSYKTFNPSDIAIHPKTNEIYVLEGKNPKLLILDPNGKIKQVKILDKKDFAQPEGIDFTADGTLYISNEANGGTANILKVEF